MITFAEARVLAARHRVSVVVELILERVANIAIGTEIDGVNELGELASGPEDAPTAVAHAR
ncbi:MAG TPA: hypothetical protein VKA32_08890 [Gammaproteobacteria bacterium]|nr:hypothetical protein [Gammaproteobacteria bacterium]